MKKIYLIAIAMAVLSCSKDDTCNQKVTGTEVKKTEVKNQYPNTNNNNVFTYKYYISLNHGDKIETNKATVDFYTGRGTVCFEGYK